MSYLNRAAAVAAAVKAGGTAFMTHFDLKVSAWYVRGVDLALPAEVLAFAERDWVHHVEWTLTEGGRLVPCVVVTCAIDDTRMLEVPKDVALQPIDADLWRDASAPSPVRPRSTVESPVKVVWRVAGEMIGAARKDVIAACVALGVDKSTASTQFYKWGKAQQG